MTGTSRRHISVGKTYLEGGIVRREDADEEPIEVRTMDPSIPQAEVGFGARMTINLGNYESVQISVEVKLPTCLEEVDEAIRTAKNLVDGKLNKEVADIKEYRAAKKGG
jgi:hypothetical protein